MKLAKVTASCGNTAKNDMTPTVKVTGIEIANKSSALLPNIEFPQESMVVFTIISFFQSELWQTASLASVGVWREPNGLRELVL